MRILRIGLYSLAVIAILIVISVVTVFTLDFGIFKNRIETLASEQTGRDVAIAGDLHINIGEKIEISAEKLTLGNAEWGTDDSLAAIGASTLSFDTWALWDNRVALLDAEFSGLHINIESDADGIGNWEITTAGGEQIASDSSDSIEPAESAMQFTLGKITITDALLSLRTAGEEKALLLPLASVKISVQDNQLDIPRYEIDITADKLDLTEYLATNDDGNLAEDGAELDIENSSDADTETAAASSERLIPDDPLPLSSLQGLHIDLHAALALLKTPSVVFETLELALTIQDGSLAITQLTAQDLDGGRLSLSSSLIPDASAGADLTFSFAGDGTSFGLLSEDNEKIVKKLTYDANAELKASGTTLRELASELTGTVRVIGGEGQTDSSLHTFIAKDFVAQLVGALNPFKESDPVTNVQCSALTLNIQDGVVSGDPAFIQKSDKLQIAGDVDIDLTTEKLSAEFNIVPKEGLGIGVTSLVNPYVKVTGTLANPSLGLDAGGVLLEGGAAVVTGGISILAKGLKDRFISVEDPCGKAVEDADKALEKQESKQADDASEG